MGFDDVMRDAARAAETALKDAFSTHLDRVADAAKGSHVFRNRTGTLEASITPGSVTGGVDQGRLEGTVDAVAPYASYVVAKTRDDFLTNAAIASAPMLEQSLSYALGDALTEALESGNDVPDGI